MRSFQGHICSIRCNKDKFVNLYKPLYMFLQAGQCVSNTNKWPTTDSTNSTTQHAAPLPWCVLVPQQYKQRSVVPVSLGAYNAFSRMRKFTAYCVLMLNHTTQERDFFFCSQVQQLAAAHAMEVKMCAWRNRICTPATARPSFCSYSREQQGGTSMQNQFACTNVACFHCVLHTMK